MIIVLLLIVLSTLVVFIPAMKTYKAVKVTYAQAKVTADAIIVYIRNKLRKELLEEYEEAREEALEIIGKKTDEVIGFYDKELEKRSTFQYQSTELIKLAKAQTSLDRAKRFVFEMKKLL